MADLDIKDADPSEPPSSEDIISLANHLLGEFNIPTKIEKLEHISAALFVILYESLFSERLPGIVRQPYTREDEIHNCQTVIDVLSSEIVHDNLSHIRGADIVAGNITAISNLLDIFSYLLEYVVNKIESDVPTDNEDKESDYGFGTLGKIESNSRSRVNGYQSRSQTKIDPKRGSMANLDKNENRSTVISHEDYYNMTSGGIRMDDVAPKYDAPPSPIVHDQSESFLGQKTVDSVDLNPVEEKRSKNASNGSSVSGWSPRTAWAERADLKETPGDHQAGSQTDDAARNVLDSQISNGNTQGFDKLRDTHPPFENETANRYTDKRFAASLPSSRCSETLGKPEPFRATVGPIEYQTKDPLDKPISDKASLEKKQEPDVVKGLSSSYNDLRDLVEKTTALTRVALRSSPVRRRAERDLDVTDLEERPRPTISSEGARRAKELNAKSLRTSKTREEPPVVKISKKVAFSSFRDDKEEERSEKKDHHSRHKWDEDDGDGGLSQVSSYGYPFSYGDRKSRFKSTGGERKEKDSHRKQKAPDSKRSLALHLARNRQPELGAAHMMLRTEDKAVKKKQDFLRRMYDDDLVDFADDVDVIITRDNEAADEVESELLKSYKNSAAKKIGASKMKTTSACKKPKMSKSTTVRTKRPMSNHRCPSSSPQLELKSDEELLSILLEKFPHLHLSDHTWHELWRKGLHQIEALTRVYQENKRKKSQAQTQMEAAAERHNLLSNIIKKQLEHDKRMREVKERKVQQVQVRNKAHDKRIQSARARRYYNEYQVRARGKQLKRRTKEEMVFRDLFKDALCIQKERINDIRKYTSDQRKRQESRRQDEIDSLENFYHDQFSMLADKMAKESQESSVRNAAQQQMLDRMKRELRKKMESEIALYQEQIFRDDDDVHFRKMDADKMRFQLHKACYTSM